MSEESQEFDEQLRNEKIREYSNEISEGESETLTPDLREEFNLSEGISFGDDFGMGDAISVEDVKEFIKRLRKIFKDNYDLTELDQRKINYEIDELAGEDLK